MNELQKQKLRRRYRREGWGKLAEELGWDPINVEASARAVLRAWWEERKMLVGAFYHCTYDDTIGSCRHEDADMSDLLPPNFIKQVKAKRK